MGKDVFVSITTLRTRRDVCVRDRTSALSAERLACPHSMRPDWFDCFELIRTPDGVYGRCTSLPLPFEIDRGPGSARDAAPAPDTACAEFRARFHDPARAQLWPAPQISLVLFDRLAQRATSMVGGVHTGWVDYICLPEQASPGLEHIFDVGYIQTVTDWPHDQMEFAAFDHHCPVCDRAHSFAGSFDGHTLQIHCPCGAHWRSPVAVDDEDQLIRDLSGKSQVSLATGPYPIGRPASLDEMRARGAREGWYPELTARDEELLAAAMDEGGVRIEGVQARDAAVGNLTRAILVAELINDCAAQYNRRQRGMCDS